MFPTKPNFFDTQQYGFWSGQFTLECLVCLKMTISEAFLRHQCRVSVILYLEKAYNTTWKWGILRDLYSYGVHARTLLHVRSFLSDRTLQVPFVAE